MARFAILGLGRFGSTLATMLAEAGADVIAVDNRKDLVESMRDKVTLAVCLNCTDEEALRAQGLDKVDVAVVGIGANFEDNVLATVILKQLGVPRVISRATTDIRGQILSRVGADDLANPEREAAERWCHRLLAPEIVERFALAEDYSLVQVPAPQGLHGKTLGQLDVRQRYKVNVVAIRRNTIETDAKGQTQTKQLVISVPMAETIIEGGDMLILIGDNEALRNFPE